MPQQPPPLQIQFQTTGIDALVKQVNKASASFKQLQKSVSSTGSGGINGSLAAATKALNDAAKNINAAATKIQQASANMRRAGSSAGGSGGSNNAGGYKSNKIPKVPGLPSWLTNTPGYKLQQMQNQLSAAQNANNPQAAAYWQKRINSANPSIGHKFMNLVKSTRVGFGHGGIQIMPLIGRTMAFLAELGPAGEAIAGVGAAAIATAGSMYMVANSAAQAANAFNRAAYTLGSGGTTTAHLGVMGAEIGMKAGDMGGLAGSFQHRMASDPMAGMALGALGLGYNPDGPYGDQDYGARLKTAIQALRKIKNRTERIRVARMAGLEQVLPMADVSAKQQSYEVGDTMTASRVFTPDMIQRSADMAAAVGRVGEAFQNLVAALSPAIIDSVTRFANDLADTLNRATDYLSANEGKARAIGDLAMGLLELMFPWSALSGAAHLSKIAGDLRGDNNTATDDAKAALDRNTGALSRNTDSHNRNTAAVNGRFGSTDRSNNAIPYGLTGPGLQKALESGGMHALPYF